LDVMFKYLTKREYKNSVDEATLVNIFLSERVLMRTEEENAKSNQADSSDDVELVGNPFIFAENQSTFEREMIEDLEVEPTKETRAKVKKQPNDVDDEIERQLSERKRKMKQSDEKKEEMDKRNAERDENARTRNKTEKQVKAKKKEIQKDKQGTGSNDRRQYERNEGNEERINFSIEKEKERRKTTKENEYRGSSNEVYSSVDLQVKEDLSSDDELILMDDDKEPETKRKGNYLIAVLINETVSQFRSHLNYDGRSVTAATLKMHQINVVETWSETKSEGLNIERSKVENVHHTNAEMPEAESARRETLHSWIYQYTKIFVSSKTGASHIISSEPVYESDLPDYYKRRS